MISRDDIAMMYHNLKEDPGRISALEAVHSLLILSLSRAQRDVYQLLESGLEVDSSNLRDRYGWKANYSGNVLKSLFRLGLATVRDDLDGIKTYSIAEER